MAGAFGLAFRQMGWHEYYTDEDFAFERLDGAGGHVGGFSAIGRF